MLENSYSSQFLRNYRVPSKEGTNDRTVHTMTKDDLKIVMSWAEKEHWNPGKYEVEPFYEADPEGYHMLKVRDEPVSSLVVVRHSENFAFLGLYITKPEYRGKGHGKYLWDVIMSKSADCPTIGLNSVISQVENYKKSNFKRKDINSINTRWVGNPSKKILEDQKFSSNNKISFIDDFSCKSDTATLTDYDGRIFSRKRQPFLNSWLNMPESHVCAAVDGSILKGYGAISVAKEGYKIAPLFADDESIAAGLLAALCEVVEDKPIQLDTNQSNPNAASLAEKFGLKPTFNTIRMYKGEPPKEQEEKIFGLTTLEIG